LYFRILLGLTGFSLISILITFFFGEELFVFCFGDKWSYAGKLSEFFVFSYAIKFFISPLAMVFIAFEELRINSIWQFFYFLGIISLYFFNDLSFETFMALYIFIDIIFYLCYGLLTYYVINKYEKNLN
jgi:O-antigen/teichoic acid export membrane protein